MTSEAEHAGSTALKVISHLVVRILAAVQEDPERLAHSNLRHALTGRSPSVELFEFASEFQLGNRASSEIAKGLLESLPPEAQVLILDIGSGTVQAVARDEAIRAREYNMVGVMIAPLIEPAWVFWRPFEDPEERYIELPPWRDYGQVLH